MLWRGKAIPRLSSVSPTLSGETLPSVSVVVAVRNEASTVGAALTSLLAQDHPDMEVIVVNDRSTDATGAILADVAARQHPHQLRVLHVGELPPGWLGKSHALWRDRKSTRLNSSHL